MDIGRHVFAGDLRYRVGFESKLATHEVKIKYMPEDHCLEVSSDNGKGEWNSQYEVAVPEARGTSKEQAAA
jgi:hypothetical protein